ncbi:multi-sensor signal transduction histidine kinase [Stanieria cyanosphaera PCC 7437]|uniref:histidine kinase n=1 Tax=Stanieria cyanosphaera (strain ATCC 29371 / PCC 7437) TaxID=111780 RepID=K9XV36_STAC7|nr:GAF domain-containing protein [Stanieria cyanosphaera]AFZ35527.1 multi-sensor signal transduction histidine kinase [Stanieria cyanosphaera PCC 7437]
MQHILDQNQPFSIQDIDSFICLLESHKLEQQKALTKIITRIQESLELENLIQVTVTEVRQLLQVDRVAVFRFEPDGIWNNGKFIAEDVDPQWNSLLEQQVQGQCFVEQYAINDQNRKIQAIADVDNSNLKECYLNLLNQFQIRANLVVPLLQCKSLWGLLCLHQCSGIRAWTDSEIEFVQQIAEHLEIAIQHNKMLMQAKWQAKQQKTQTRVIAHLRESLNLDEIFKATVTEVRQLLDVDRVAVFRFQPESDWNDGEFIAEDVDRQWNSVLAKSLKLTSFGQQEIIDFQRGKIQAVTDVNHTQSKDCHLENLQQLQIRANLIVPLLQGKLLWGLLCIHQCSGIRAWTEPEIEFVQQIAQQLEVALQQSDYIEQMKLQSAQLANAEKQKWVAERQQIIVTTINKICQSLDLKIIFQTATEEVRQLFKADRVAIYRFNSDWSGNFVAESMTEGWTPLVGTLPKIRDTHLQETQGGRYAHNETFAVDDIYQVGHAQCHLELLKQFEAKAYAIAPIFQGEKLWGLLAAYQNSSPRHWEEDEISLLRQIGWQLGVALQQAEYLQRVQEKASERQRALATTIEKIRRSLDIDTIFKTTTQEVRQLLQVERVAIYRFHSDWSGEFVADSIADDWTSLTQAQIQENRLIPESKNDQYPRNETFVPILQGEKLWGLLMAYQAFQPRYWQQEEVNLLAQVGVQLGIALQQAELLQQTQQQAQELALALKNLQQSQIQLIQGEKLAGLGQLIAGIAHEINTPLGTIKTAVGNMTRGINEALEQLPYFCQWLNSNEQCQFFALIEQAIKQPTLVTGRQKRTLKQSMVKRLELYQLKDPVWVADRLIDINIYGDEIEPFISLLKQDNSEFILQLAYNLARLPNNSRAIKTAVERVTKIVAALKNYARYDNSNQQYQVQIIEGLENALELFHNKLKQNIEVIRDYQPIPPIWCFPDELIQVWTNLIHNAIQAIKKQGILTISTFEEANGIKVRITDSGTGIAPEIQAKIFDPFFTTKPIGEGNGLGLYICKKIIDKHQGQIEIDTQPGQTIFTVWLPFQITE